MARRKDQALQEPAHEGADLTSEADVGHLLAAQKGAEQDENAEAAENDSSEWEEESMFGDALEALNSGDMGDSQSHQAFSFASHVI